VPEQTQAFSTGDIALRAAKSAAARPKVCGTPLNGLLVDAMPRDE
jgi:hypothetical protein